MKILGLKLNQIAFVVGSVLILASLPWFGIWEVWLWLGAQIIILLGVVFLLKNL